MSWRQSSVQPTTLNTSLPLSWVRPTSESLPWEGSETTSLPVLVEERLQNKTLLRPDLPALGQADECFMSPVLTTCLVACYCVTMTLGLVGNAGLMCIIVRRKERANVTSIFICNLSLSDVLVCAFCLPFTITYTLMDHWVFGSVLCRVVPFVQCVSVTVSILSLVFIALERHQLIINPAGWKPSAPQAYVAVIAIWALACFTSLPFLAFQVLSEEPYSDLAQPWVRPLPRPRPQPRSNATWLRSVSDAPPSSPAPFTNPYPSTMPLAPTARLEACLEHWPSREERLAYTTWLLLFQYCGPLLLVLLCYVRVFVRLRRRKDMLDRARAPEFQQVTHSRRINLMLLTLVTAFALCWLPLTVFNVVSDWRHEALPVCLHDLLFSLCHLLAMSSTCVNPIIYGFLNSNFRQEVREALQRCWWRPLQEQAMEHLPMSTMHIETSRTTVNLNQSLSV